MIRFIEIGNQIYCLGNEDTSFAWFTTISDRFININDTEEWETWRAFEQDFYLELEEGELPESWNLERFWGLYPNYRKKREGILKRHYIGNQRTMGC